MTSAPSTTHVISVPTDITCLTNASVSHVAIIVIALIARKQMAPVSTDALIICMVLYATRCVPNTAIVVLATSLTEYVLRGVKKASADHDACAETLKMIVSKTNKK